jgi:hypothetical protein
MISLIYIIQFQFQKYKDILNLQALAEKNQTEKSAKDVSSSQKISTSKGEDEEMEIMKDMLMMDVDDFEKLGAHDNQVLDPDSIFFNGGDASQVVDAEDISIVRNFMIYSITSFGNRYLIQNFAFTPTSIFLRTTVLTLMTGKIPRMN